MVKKNQAQGMSGIWERLQHSDVKGVVVDSEALLKEVRRHHVTIAAHDLQDLILINNAMNLL